MGLALCARTGKVNMPMPNSYPFLKKLFLRLAFAARSFMGAGYKKRDFSRYE
jgi:hypothetical protein